jgi:hypothetical protein
MRQAHAGFGICGNNIEKMVNFLQDRMPLQKELLSIELIENTGKHSGALIASALRPLHNHPCIHPKIQRALPELAEPFKVFIQSETAWIVIQINGNVTPAKAGVQSR